MVKPAAMRCITPYARRIVARAADWARGVHESKWVGTTTTSVMDRNSAMAFTRPQRYFACFETVGPDLEEGLLAPHRTDDKRSDMRRCLAIVAAPAVPALDS
jgi:hypothetical protein